MIEIIKTKPSKKVNQPYYSLKYNYMIGDADGNTTETVKISKDNPYLERYLVLLDKLKPTPGYWGISLEENKLKDHLKVGQISKDDYEFLKRIMFCEDSEFKVSKENEDFANEFYEGVVSDTEYSFLSFEGFELKYVDEFGVKHKTKIK